MEKYKCICGQEFSSTISLGRHKSKCEMAIEEKQNQLKILKIEEQNYTYICKCGRKFKSSNALNAHSKFCDCCQKKEKPISKYLNIDTSIYTCECGYNTKNYQSLNAHFSHCQIHRDINNKGPVKKRENPNFQKFNFKNISKEKHQEICKLADEVRKIKFKNGELSGHSHTEESKEKIRQARYKYLSDKKQHGAFINGKHSYIEEQFAKIINENKLYENFDIVEEYAQYPYFLDFALPNLKIDIELDGKFHQYEQNKIHDQKRTKKLNSEGWRVIRYTYDDIINNKDFQQNILNLFSSLNDINHHINSKIYTYQEYKQLLSQ